MGSGAPAGASVQEAAPHVRLLQPTGAEAEVLAQALNAAVERVGWRAIDGAAGCAGADCLGTLSIRTIAADGPERSGVELVLTTPDGARYPGRGHCALGRYDACARAALRDARGLRLLGPGPWLEVRGDPRGAVIWVDGVRVGEVPYRDVVAPGAHEVVLRARGYHGQRYRIRCPKQPDLRVTLPVALPPHSERPG